MVMALVQVLGSTLQLVLDLEPRHHLRHMLSAIEWRARPSAE
jgi:hypothetical protein